MPDEEFNVADDAQISTGEPREPEPEPEEEHEPETVQPKRQTPWTLSEAAERGMEALTASMIDQEEREASSQVKMRPATPQELAGLFGNAIHRAVSRETTPEEALRDRQYEAIQFIRMQRKITGMLSELFALRNTTQAQVVASARKAINRWNDDMSSVVDAVNSPVPDPTEPAPEVETKTDG